ncbi:hypothetical protein YDYSY3_39130 [Paenibacillus chitinolyticus]|uniref:DUF4145 domain-containing protein n=1 Tax=Paenibacillus chitinolyticus TaxID=79263 RepID=UPI0026E4D9AB|nr:DUF4145 domain-containing protein [Paenibacillus chitinolyticus]GKS12913.1 hypothetical protein YDYSY3_39130 [Paenibacillus chitinolyticus]
MQEVLTIKLAKEITKENYYLPCDAIKLFSGDVSEEVYIDNVKDICVNEKAPEQVREMFEVAKALYVYGYLYWTFFTISFEQSLKSWEVAITMKLNEVNIQRMPRKLINKINALEEMDIISSDEKELFHYVRLFRNGLAHPDYQSQLGHNNRLLISVANQINLLYK